MLTHAQSVLPADFARSAKLHDFARYKRFSESDIIFVIKSGFVKRVEISATTLVQF